MSFPFLNQISQTLSGIRQDIHPFTLLLIGICLHALPSALLPTRYTHHAAVLLPAAALLWLVYRAAVVALVTLGWFENPYAKETFVGTSQATLRKKDGSVPENKPTPDSGSDRGVVCFVVGWSINHPAGRLAPGASKVAGFWDKDWEDLEKNTESFGFLGRSPPLIGKSDAGGTHIISITYWKTLEDLANYSRSPSHMAGLQHIRSTGGKYPHLGLMHETYVIPRGHWENLYYNSPPIAFGQVKYRVESEAGDKGKVSSLVRTTGGGMAFKRLRNITSSSDI